MAAQAQLPGRAPTRPRRLRPSFHGVTSIPQLFAFAFDRATERLSGEDVATLRRVPVGALDKLDWIPSATISELSSLLDALAQRDRVDRYQLRRLEQEALSRIVARSPGSYGRRLFVLALLIDRAFSRFGADHEAEGRLFMAHAEGGVTVPPPVFFDVENLPPPIGQMTAVAIGRRWFRNFWVVGRLDQLRGFGRFPQPQAVRLPARTKASLQEAVNHGELRIAIVTWRRHVQVDLRLAAAPPGCFAVLGLREPAPQGLLAAVVDALYERRAHIALLPELALDQGELDELTRALRERGRRFPALVVAGLVHRPVRSGASHVNETVVLNAQGEEVTRYEKIEPFTTAAGLMEDIVPRRSGAYPFIDSPVGRIVVNICRDVRSDVPSLLNRALGTNLLLVPTYSTRMDFVLEEARVLGQRQAAITAATNPLVAGLRDLAAFYAPVRGDLGRLVKSDEAGPQVAQNLGILVFRARLGDNRQGVLQVDPLSAM